MENSNKKPLVLDHAAVLVVDMLQDFVYGALACDRGKAIVPATARLLDAAREAGIPVIFCNDARLFHFSYQRYLENQIRAVFGLTGTPIKITVRQKGDSEET